MDAGLSRYQWELALSQALLHKVRAGVYLAVLDADPRVRHCQMAAAAMKARSNYMACSGSALAILGLPNPYFRSWSQVPVTMAAPKSDLRANIRRSPGWAPIDTAWGPCTSGIDTAATIAAELPLPQALMVTDAIARLMAGVTPGQQMTNAQRIEVASEACRTEIRRRLTKYSDLPALALANPAAEAPSESFFRGHMVLQGYDDPACGVPMRGASGNLYFLDLMLPGLAIEVDGKAKYLDLGVLTEEKRREDDLRLTGLDFLRSWVEDLYEDPARQMAQLTQKILGTYPQAYPHLRITTAV